MPIITPAEIAPAELKLVCNVNGTRDGAKAGDLRVLPELEDLREGPDPDVDTVRKRRHVALVRLLQHDDGGHVGEVFENAGQLRKQFLRSKINIFWQIEQIFGNKIASSLESP
jgi:hypothetical protein